MSAHLFSIVIPCRNEKGFIGKTLDSIQQQTVIDDSVPIFIADANSTDGTIDIIKSYFSALNIWIIDGGLPPEGRNNGARFCNSKYVLFIDADIELRRRDTLEIILKYSEAMELELAIPRIKIDNGGFLDKLFEYAYYFAAKTKILGPFGAGMFILIRKSTFNRLGGFNESLALGDDWDLTHRVKSRYFEIINVPVYTTNRRFVAQGYFTTYCEWIFVAMSKKYRSRDHKEYFLK